MRAALSSGMGGRERMLSEGPGFLSEEELLAVLLGSGTRAFPATEVAARLMRGGLSSLRRARFASLVELPGIGESQACRVLAALELGRRAVAAPPEIRIRLWNAGLVARGLFPRLAVLEHEEFWVLLLNARLEEMRAVRISMGGLTHCSVQPREALAPALIFGAPILLFAHNHPSGDPEPSQEDRRLQAALDAAARTMGLRVADHVVLAEGGMHSLREGLLPPPPIPGGRGDPDEPDDECASERFDLSDDAWDPYDLILEGAEHEYAAGYGKPEHLDAEQ